MSATQLCFLLFLFLPLKVSSYNATIHHITKNKLVNPLLMGVNEIESV